MAASLVKSSPIFLKPQQHLLISSRTLDDQVASKKEGAARVMEKLKVSASPPIWQRVWRAAKTLFFVVTMVGSLFLFCAPSLLVAVLDIVVPIALLNAYSTSLMSINTILADLKSFDLKSSLVDVPLLSIARSLLILGTYSFCDVPGRSREPYLAMTMLCSTLSTMYVTAKALVMFQGLTRWSQRTKELDVELLLVSSMLLIVAHIGVAYKTSCRERRKLVVYRIDLEAVPQCKSVDYSKSYM